MLTTGSCGRKKIWRPNNAAASIAAKCLRCCHNRGDLFLEPAIQKLRDGDLLADEDCVLTEFSSQMDRPQSAVVQDQDALFRGPCRIVTDALPRKKCQALADQDILEPALSLEVFIRRQDLRTRIERGHVSPTGRPISLQQ